MHDPKHAAAGVSLKVLFAAAGRKAVILRRGPREHYHLINWDLDADTFQRGQWLRGVVRLSDLSADGGRLLYWAAQYHRPRMQPSASVYYQPAPALVRSRGRRRAPRYLREQIEPARPVEQIDSFSTWTAISKPPYFTALAIWPSIGTWTGGGYFGEDGAIYLAEFQLDPICNAGPPDVPVHAIPARSPFTRSARFGDVESDDARQSDLALELYMAGADRIHWVDLASEAGVSFAYDGRVYRSKASASAAPKIIAAQARLIADFTGLTFEQIKPGPSALRW